jgi:hypothetical protein
MNGNPERNSPASGLSRRRLLVSLGVLTAAAGVGGRLFAPSARAQSAGGVFVGKVDGTDSFVGIVTDGQQAEAYVCNGSDFRELFTGMLADARDGRLTLTGEDGDLLPIDVDQNSLQSLLASGASLTGTLTVGANSNAFRADPATGPGALYLSIGDLPDGSTMDGGTIVLNDGELRGFFKLIKGFIDTAGTVLAAATGNPVPGSSPVAQAAGVALKTVSNAVISPGSTTTNVAKILGGALFGATAEVESIQVDAPDAPPPAGGAPGPATQPLSPAMMQAAMTLQSGRALSGPNGPQAVSMPVTLADTNVNVMMKPQTPGDLAVHGPPH